MDKYNNGMNDVDVADQLYETLTISVDGCIKENGGGQYVCGVSKFFL